MTLRNLQLASAAAFLLGGCMSAAEAADVESGLEDEAHEVVSVGQTQIALRAGTSVEPGKFDGYCENGVGVFLSAQGDKAALTVYVVTPAERAVFVHPQLRLTTQDGNTQVTEFEDVTLEAGESHVFGEYAEAELADVVAELSTL